MATLNQWNPWTAKSAHVAYDYRPAAGVGKGEYKVAAEEGVAVNGQNVSYDLDLPIGHGEVKELDTDKSIRCGKNVRDAYRPIMARIMSLLSIFEDVKEMTLLPSETRALLVHLAEISPDEISQGNLKKLETACSALSAYRESLLTPLATVPLFDPMTGEKREVRADLFFETALASGATHDRIRGILGPAMYTTVCMTSLLRHPYIETPDQLMSDLRGCRSVFRGTILVLVDPVRGYYLMTNPEEKLVMYRVTSTSPRFRVPI
jgi:hypothetical protein